MENHFSFSKQVKRKSSLKKKTQVDAPTRSKNNEQTWTAFGEQIYIYSLGQDENIISFLLGFP